MKPESNFTELSPDYQSPGIVPPRIIYFDGGPTQEVDDLPAEGRSKLFDGGPTGISYQPGRAVTVLADEPDRPLNTVTGPQGEVIYTTQSAAAAQTAQQRWQWLAALVVVLIVMWAFSRKKK